MAAEKAPDDDTYKFYLASALHRSGRTAEAVRILEGLATKGTDLAEAYNYLGYIYVEDNKDLDRAIELVQKALLLDPQNGAYLDSLGWAYYKKGMLDEALEALSMAAGEMPDDAVIRDHLGDVYAARGQLQEAEGEWQLSLELDPGSRDVKKKLEKVRNTLKRKRRTGHVQ